MRDHDAAKFAARKAQMQHIAACLNDRYGAGTVELDIKDSYYNMLEKIQPHFHLVETPGKAIRAAGLEPIETPVRGGTDGATLSYMGLPCPNLAPAASLPRPLRVHHRREDGPGRRNFAESGRAV